MSSSDQAVDDRVRSGLNLGVCVVVRVRVKNTKSKNVRSENRPGCEETQREVAQRVTRQNYFFQI